MKDTRIDEIIGMFNDNKGYMTYSELRKLEVSAVHISEMRRTGKIEKISRGVYWCVEGNVLKPRRYKYVEMLKVNPNSVICMQSACYIHGIIKKEPNEVHVSMTREDKSKMSMRFPVHTHHLKPTNLEGELKKCGEVTGDFNVYSLERTICDCVRVRGVAEEVYEDIISYLKNMSARKRKNILKKSWEYAKVLKATNHIERLMDKLEEK